MKLRPVLEVGYLTYSGYVLNKDDCKALNYSNSRINQRIKEGLEISEHMLNGAHHLFKSIAEQCIGKNPPTQIKFEEN